jgi:alpha-galactosidase
VLADHIDATRGPERRRHAILNLVKVAFIGAGSTVFAKTLIGDLLSYPELADDMTVALMDTDEDRLRTSELVARRIVETTGAHARVEASRDRRAVLDGADYVLTMMQVGGYRPATVTDFEVPKEFGLRQTIGDTLGIGGIMRGLRTIPVLLDVCRDMEGLCPEALLLQYVNPMAMLCWAVARASSISTVGLCHSVQGTAGDLERDLGLPPGELEYVCAGINHLAFYLELVHEGRDVYPDLREKADSPRWNRVRYEVLRHFGYFCTESSEHLAEYVPWFIKQARPELVDAFNVPLDEYPRRCEAQIAEWEGLRDSLKDGIALATARSDEYGARIVHALETGEPFTFNGNVMNDGLIENLQECCVEVPCVAGERGISPQPVGSLPPQLAALIQTNVNVQALTVEAALTGRREHVYHAAMLDPHTAAELPLSDIHELVDRLLEAHGELVPALG